MPGCWPAPFLVCTSDRLLSREHCQFIRRFIPLLVFLPWSSYLYRSSFFLPQRCFLNPSDSPITAEIGVFLAPHPHHDLKYHPFPSSRSRLLLLPLHFRKTNIAMTYATHY